MYHPGARNAPARLRSMRRDWPVLAANYVERETGERQRALHSGSGGPNTAIQGPASARGGSLTTVSLPPIGLEVGA